MKSKQEKLANLFVQNVPKFGWSRDTLLQCAKKQRISTSVLAKLFPSFEYDVLKFIIAQNNNKVEKNYNSFNNSRLNTRDKIITIMELKFENNNQQIEIIESGYEYLLAYAAQGKETDQAGSTISEVRTCLLYTSPSPRDRQKSRMPSSA